MKRSFKTVMTLLIVASIAIPSFSQTNRFGISINSLNTGFNYGESNSTLQSHKQSFKGIQAGFSYQAGVSSGFSIAPEVYFAIKGGVLKGGNPLTVNKSTFRLYSVEVPLLARVHCKNLYLNAGPYGGYMLGGRLKVQDSEALPGSSTRITFGNATSDFRRWDYGIQAGAGYNFNLKKSTLTLDIRYGYGLANISRDIERYNRMLNISLVAAKLGKKSWKRG